MYTKKICTLIIAAIMPFYVFSFEGIVIFEMENPEIDEKALVHWHTKNDNHLLKYSTAFEEGNYDYHILIQAGSSELLMYAEVEGEKNLTRVPLELIEMQHNAWTTAEVTQTGETQQYAGYETIAYRITSPTGYAICYISQDANLSTLTLPRAFSSGGVIIALDNHDIEGAILHLEVYDLEGELLYMQTVNEVNITSLDNNIFELPEGYSEQRY